MSNLELIECFIGKHLSEKCHVRKLTRTIGFIKISELKHEDQELLKWRCKISLINDESQICFHHEQKFIHQYEKCQYRCADPFKKHKNIVKSKSFLNE